MASELQRIVDAVGRRLKRAVAIDDARLRLQAYSSHFGTVDPVRLASIPSREAPEDARRWVLSLGVAEAREPVRVPPNPGLGMDARVCAPIRYEGRLLGYLWLVDTEQSLTQDELVVAASSAEAAGVVMYRERLVSELERGRERELLRDLLAEDSGVRRHAAAELVEANLFVSGSPVAVLVVRPVRGDESQLDERARVAIGVALDAVRSEISPRHGLQLVRPDHGLVVVATKDPALRAAGRVGLGEDLRGALAEALPDAEEWRVLVGIGEPHRSLADTAASYREALQALRVATIVRSFGPLLEWSQLGIYRMLSLFPVERLAADALHPGLVKLFEHRDAEPLVHTLEHYLDRACDAKTTAADLELHRASLYYRLHKIEQIADASLRDGEDRLALHLGLKIARLAGIHPLQQRR